MLSSEEIDILQNLLLEKLADIESMTEDRDEKAKPVELDQQSFGRVSRIDAIQQQQIAKAHQFNAEKELRMIKSALNKIEMGDYGFCEACDEDITFSRLKVNPSARFCIPCQERQE